MRDQLCNLENNIDCDGTSRSGVILFRDYGVHDMTMYRHSVRHGETFFRRNDTTLAFYFDLEYIREIAEKAGLQCLELEYATVSVRNRKENCKQSQKQMDRVFVHAVLAKI
jgi:hypothetical protein